MILNTTISVRLPLEDPFIFNDSSIIGQVNQSPYFVLIHGSHSDFKASSYFAESRVIIAGQKNYVLDAPLGDRPIAGADADVMNVWLAQYDECLIV